MTASDEPLKGERLPPGLYSPSCRQGVFSDEELDEIAAGKAKRSRHSQFLDEAAGITEEMKMTALGPDRDRIPKEEQVRRIIEYLADAWFGEKAYRVHKLVRTAD